MAAEPLPTSEEDDFEDENAWLRFLADVFADLADPAEDIYAPTDGEPFPHAHSVVLT